MIKTVVFDFGNVLVFFDHRRALDRLVTHTDRTGEELMRLVYHDDLAYRYERGQVTTAELFRLGCERGGLRCNEREFIAAFCDIFWPNPPMADLVPRLKRNGYRLVLASNTNDAHYAHFREAYRDLLRHFDAISVSHEAGARKPEPEFFAHTHRLTGSEKSECVFVDDLAENVAAARRFGWRGIQYTGFDELVSQLNGLGVRLE
jgi:putative hydrolase of the HAD superfamily